MNEISKYISLKQYVPIGTPEISNFELKSEEIKIENTDEVMVLNEFISVDPYMRARMTEKKNYKEPFKIGKAMDGLAIGKVIQTNSNNFNLGDIVSSNFAWRDKYATSEKNIKKKINQDIPLSAYLGPLGMTGHTAYIGLFKIGETFEFCTVIKLLVFYFFLFSIQLIIESKLFFSHFSYTLLTLVGLIKGCVFLCIKF